mmetsp:Transcript_103801/g.224030  ORF Transcript_103801/g.224030 Transcript_103801/m.224030 type:complete len:80 (+) Transcript_103801:571-810(+)
MVISDHSNNGVVQDLIQKGLFRLRQVTKHNYYECIKNLCFEHLVLLDKYIIYKALDNNHMLIDAKHDSLKQRLDQIEQS